MDQVFSELEQFGLVFKKNNELEINHKYLILGFNIIQSDEKNLINLSQKIETYLSQKNETYLFSKKISNTTKKITKNEKINKIKKIVAPSSSICTFSYVKYIGIYKGKTNIYENNFYCGKNRDKKYYSSSSDEEEYEKTIEKKQCEKKQYEYIIGDDIFTKNNEFYILEKMTPEMKLLLFEVDDSFNDVNFLNTILMIFSNIESDRNKFITVTCSNKNITIESTHGTIPVNYDKTLEYDKNKKYSLDTDFIFFK